jgi:hypothetical protein
LLCDCKGQGDHNRRSGSQHNPSQVFHDITAGKQDAFAAFGRLVIYCKPYQDAEKGRRRPTPLRSRFRKSATC